VVFTDVQICAREHDVLSIPSVVVLLPDVHIPLRVVGVPVDVDHEALYAASHPSHHQSKYIFWLNCMRDIKVLQETAPTIYTSKDFCLPLV
jgi:hypothetical protein